MHSCNENERIAIAAAVAGQNGADSARMQADSPFSSSKRHNKKATASVRGTKHHDEDEAPICPQIVTDAMSCSNAPPADLIRCQSDIDCAGFSRRKCCYDGCRLACLVAVSRPVCTFCAVLMY